MTRPNVGQERPWLLFFVLIMLCAVLHMKPPSNNPTVLLIYEPGKPHVNK